MAEIFCGARSPSPGADFIVGAQRAVRRLRGVGPAAFEIRKDFQIVDGRPFEWGRNEIIVGQGAAAEFAGLDLGKTVLIGKNEWSVVGVFSAGGGVSESEITAQLTANVNNYAPTGWGEATIVLLDTDGSDYDITGFDASVTSIRKTIVNTDSAQSITLKHEDSNSSATNRIITHGTDFVLGPNDVCQIFYDTTNSRWRVY